MPRLVIRSYDTVGRATRVDLTDEGAASEAVIGLLEELSVAIGPDWEKSTAPAAAG